MSKALGRLVPPDDLHLQKYPLMASQIPEQAVPVIAGVHWYSSFDNPVKDKDGKWWVGRSGSLGYLRGGHCVCLPHTSSDTWGWHLFYDQGTEGACVGFGASRAMSLLNRKRYAARWLYHEAQKVDIWPGGAYQGAYPFYEGTTVRAAMDILRDQGHRVRGEEPRLLEGISANRWATSIDQVFRILKNKTYDKLGAIPFHNSWGTEYPQKVWMPGEVWDRLLREWGEFTLFTDR